MQHGTAVRGDTEKTKPLFERSDAYILTRNGTVAHTFMSSGVHADYHQPSDDVSRVDFGHMQAATMGVLPAIRWLASSDFRPQWRTGLAPVVMAPAKQVGEQAAAAGGAPLSYGAGSVNFRKNSQASRFVWAAVL